MPEVVFGFIALLATGLYIREYSLRKKREKQALAGEEDKKNYGTIAALTEKSHQLTKEAEADTQKLLNDAKVFTQHQAQDFGSQLNQLLQYEQAQTDQAVKTVSGAFSGKEAEFERFMKHLTDVLENKTDASLKEFAAFLEGLRDDSQKSQAANWEGAKARVNELFENFETKLADFLLQTEQKMMLSVDLELKSARQLIDTYKVQQMNIIDENIVAMLEKTLSLVLGKNLNLKDQVDLVYESLERAKTESFLV